MTVPHGTSGKAVLDGALVRVLRLAAGMSERDLAGKVGFSTTTLVSVESGLGQTARVAESVSINQMRLLAEALGVPVAALVLPEPQAAPAAPDDAKALGALLMHADRLISPEDLADALGWTLDRVHAAAADLRPALAAVGMTITSGGYRAASIRLASATAGTSPAERSADTARRDAKGMHRAQAVVLWRIVNGTFGLRSTTNAYRTFYAGLLKQGLALHQPDGTPVPSDAVRYGLDF